MAAMSARYLTHFALLVTTFGTKDEAAACAPGPGRGGQDVLDANSFLQLVTESGAALNASGVEEASAGAKPVEQIAGGELDVMSKALDVMDTALGKEMGVVDKALDVVENGMEHIVGMKTMEMAAEERKQRTDPAGPQKVQGPGPDDEPPYPLAPPPTPGTQEEARGAAANGTQAVEHILDRRVLGDQPFHDPSWADSTVEVLDLVQPGFRGGFTDGTYGYTVPLWANGARHGNVVRFDLASFSLAGVLDLAFTDTALEGFSGGFADGTYGYLIPDRNRAGDSGKVGRFVLAGFNTPEALDLADHHYTLKRFFGGFTDGTYGYAMPYGISTSGNLGRFDLATFSTTEALDLKVADPTLSGFYGGFAYGAYGYALPYKNGIYHFFGTVARFDLAAFNTSTVATLNLEAIDPLLVGFYGGFTDGTYGYVIPMQNNEGVRHGIVVRFDLAGFTTIATLNLEAVDTALKGFGGGGFTDGTYGYAIPYHNGEVFGKVARFDLAGFVTVAVLDLASTDTALKGSMGGFTTGTYGYVITYDTAKVARFGVIKSDRDDQSSVVGDPHVVNVAHARFEIRAEGMHKLVQIPRLIQTNGKPDLRVDAKIQHLVSNDCSKSFMTSLSIFGRWTEDAFGLIRISQGSDMPNTTLLINTLSPEEFFTQFPFPGVKAGRASVAFTLKDVSFHVGKHFEGRYGQQQAYLNVRITGLKKHNDLGGLLGYDGHADAEKPDVNCMAAKPAAAYQSSFVSHERSAPIITDGGSRIEAE